MSDDAKLEVDVLDRAAVSWRVVIAPVSRVFEARGAGDAVLDVRCLGKGLGRFDDASTIQTKYSTSLPFVVNASNSFSAFSTIV